MATMITGGTGLLGARIASKLTLREKPVLFDNNPALWRIEDIKDGVEVVRGNVVNLHEIIHAIQKYKIDKVIHLASMLGAESNENPLAAAYVSNIGTVNIYEAGRLCGLERICIASSIAVYGADDEYQPSELPVTEDSPAYLAKGTLTYAAAKVYMEALGRLYREKYNVFVCGLRPGMVYGWGRESGNSAFLGELIAKPALGQPVKVGNGNASVGLVYVDDVVEQWLALLDSAKGRFKHYYYNTGADTVKVRELAEIVKRIIPAAKIEVQCGEEKNVGGIVSRVSEKFLEIELGIKRQYTPLELGIEAMIRDVRNRSNRNQ